MIMYKELKKINKTFLVICILGIFLPILYSWLRVIWIVSDSQNTIQMASTWIYIQIIVEVFTAMIILPLFTYSKENKKKSPTIFISVFVITIIVFYFLVTFFPWLFQKMLENDANLLFTHKELRIFLIIAMASSSLKILEKFLISDIIVERDSIEGIFTIGVNMFIKIFFDLLLISPLFISNFNLIYLSLSSLVSSIIIIFVLTLYWIFKYKKNNVNWIINFSDLKEFYRKGIWPGAEVFVRNLFYFLVTLSILNQLSGDNAFVIWNYGGWIYWVIIIQLSNSFRYSLLSERVNNKEANLDVLTNCYILFDLIIYIFLTPLAIKFILPTIIDDEFILKSSTQTAWALSISMFYVSAYGKLTTKFMTENKYIYMFFITLVNSLLISLPVKIFMLAGGQVNYAQNLIIFELGIFTSFIMGYFLYNFSFTFKREIKKKI